MTNAFPSYTPPQWRDMWLGALVFATLPAYVVLQAVLLIRLPEPWRARAARPLFVMVPILGISIIGTIAGANLWFIWIVFASPVALVYLVGLLLVMRRQRAREVR